MAIDCLIAVFSRKNTGDIARISCVREGDIPTAECLFRRAFVHVHFHLKRECFDAVLVVTAGEKDAILLEVVSLRATLIVVASSFIVVPAGRIDPVDEATSLRLHLRADWAYAVVHSGESDIFKEV